MFRALMQHKLTVFGVSILAALALWYGLSQSGASAPTIVTSSAEGTSNTVGGAPVAGPVDKDTQQILEILLALRAVKLDDAIFSSQSFTSLKDFSTQIVPEPVGRPDPFAPLSGESPSPVSASALPASPSAEPLGSAQKGQTLQMVPHQKKAPATGK